MTPFKRRAIAFLVAKLINRSNASSIFDYSMGSYHTFSGQVNNNINIYDYDRSCYLSGNISGNNGSVYDYGTNTYITITINGNNFNGYDYESSHFYSGTVINNSISLFDYGVSQYFNFSV